VAGRKTLHGVGDHSKINKFAILSYKSESLVENVLGWQAKKSEI
jgi:hypothetical protein